MASEDSYSLCAGSDSGQSFCGSLLDEDEERGATRKVASVDPPSVAKETLCANCGSHVAMCFCAQCDQDLCVNCDDQIHKIRIFINHQRVELSKKPKPPIKCQVHKGEIAKLFCTDAGCRTFVCVLCAFGSHLTHKCQTIEDVKNDEKRSLNKDIQACDDYIAQFEARAFSLGTAESELLENSANVVAKLNEDFDETISFLESKRTQIKSGISDIVRGRVTKIKELEEQTEQHCSASSRTLSAAEKLSEDQENISFLSQVDKIARELRTVNTKAQAAVHTFTKVPVPSSEMGYNANYRCPPPPASKNNNTNPHCGSYSSSTANTYGGMFSVNYYEDKRRGFLVLAAKSNNQGGNSGASTAMSKANSLPILQAITQVLGAIAAKDLVVQR